MAEYFLSGSAKSDLKNIYRFGFERFGEQQADRYFTGLIACFEEIAEHPLMYQHVPEFGNDYRRCVYISDTIYYRIVGDRVEIMAIIGRQDFPARL